jgi:hypothetical protein
MRLFRLFLAAVLLAGFWLSPLSAEAGTITVSPAIWSNREGTNRPVALLNRSDCLNDATVTFNVRIAAVSSSAILELWVGSGCDTYSNRTSANRTCAQVTTGVTANTSLNTAVKARFQDMVKPFGSTESGTAATCNLETSTGQVTRSLFFVVYNSGSTMSEATVMPWAFKYDIRAPGPPTNITARGGENSLVVGMTAPSGESNLLRYHFYCSPASSSTSSTGGSASTAGTGGTDTTSTGGTDATSSAGADTGGTDTGGTDTGGTSGTTSSSAGSSGTAAVQPAPAGCYSDVLVPNEPPSADAVKCGSVGAQGTTSGETSQVLDNYSTYAVAVATEDSANNIGVLSQIACGTPEDVTGFYEAYREAGGQAGGGFCGFAPARTASLSWLAIFGAAAAALGWRRR